MHQTMEIYMARKKRVPGHFNPDSNRIFHNEITDESLGDSRMNKFHIERKRAPHPSHPREPERRNCPHPWHSRFLRHNVMLLNEPICVMATEATDAEQNQWWPNKLEKMEKKIPAISKDSTHRKDYQKSAPAAGNTRHGSNPFTIPSQGILPVNEPRVDYSPGKVLLEKISYAHNYNSRWDRNEPIRGKLHGSFVWNEVLKDDKNNDEVVTPWNRSKLHRCMTVAVPQSIPPKNKENKTPPPVTVQPSLNTELNTAKEHSLHTKNNNTLPSIDGLPSL